MPPQAHFTQIPPCNLILLSHKYAQTLGDNTLKNHSHFVHFSSKMFIKFL